MFSQLIDGLRHVRNPLLLGYSFLFSAWILFAGFVPTSTEAATSDDRALRHIARLFDEIGTGGRTGLVTVLALFVGSILNDLLTSDPTPAGKQALLRRFTSKFELSGDVITIPAFAAAQVNGSETESLKRDALRLLEEAERMVGEIEARQAAAWSTWLLIPSLLIMSDNPWPWAFAMFAAITIITSDQMLKSRLLNHDLANKVNRLAASNKVIRINSSSPTKTLLATISSQDNLSQPVSLHARVLDLLGKLRGALRPEQIPFNEIEELLIRWERGQRPDDSTGADSTDVLLKVEALLADFLGLEPYEVDIEG